MDSKLRNAFIIHVCKYLGIALVSGSIVHAGTLGGSSGKYIILSIGGVLLTVAGNYLENKEEHRAVDTRFLALAIALSFGTGMLSGGIQHYLDNPAYGALLLGLGTLMTFIALAYKDFSTAISKQALVVVTVISIILYSFLAFIVPNALPETSNQGESINTHH